MLKKIFNTELASRSNAGWGGGRGDNKACLGGRQLRSLESIFQPEVKIALNTVIFGVLIDQHYQTCSLNKCNRRKIRESEDDQSVLKQMESSENTRVGR